MGDSAGGNLAAVVAMRDPVGDGDGSDVPAPVAQGLVYPALDARLESESARTLADGFFLTVADHGVLPVLLRARPVAVGVRRASPRCWPTTTAGLAPALVVTAGFDPLRDDGAPTPRHWRSRRRGRVPLLRRPGPRVHGHGNPPGLAGPGHRGV